MVAGGDQKCRGDDWADPAQRDQCRVDLSAKGNWFRENWDLAHELAHLIGLKSEDEANAYAAELLLPAALVQRVD